MNKAKLIFLAAILSVVAFNGQAVLKNHSFGHAVMFGPVTNADGH